MASFAKERAPLILLAIAALVAAVLSGLARTGIKVPEIFLDAAQFHSVLMISGFFGTVIGLERAVASRLSFPYLTPLLSGIAGGLLLAGASITIVISGFVLAGICFVATTLLVVIKQPAIYTFTLLAGAMLWLIGNVIWGATGNPMTANACGLTFLVLTIAGERLELTRFLPPKRLSKALFGGIVLSIIAASLMSALSSPDYPPLLGTSYCALAIWMFSFDIARKTVRKNGITRFVAICLLFGYFWLLIGGALLAGEFTNSPYQRDAAIHSISIGFIFSMVIGHAPIIFPAVMRVKIPYSWIFYIPLAILNLGVAARVMGGLFESTALRTSGVTINAIAIGVFLFTLMLQVIRNLSRPVDKAYRH